MNRTLAALVVALTLPSAASATLFTYQATLDGASEVPVNASAGTGTATVIYDDVAETLHVSASFSGLSGLVTAAHIHCCVSPLPAVQTAGVRDHRSDLPGFPSGVTSGSYSQLLDLTQTSSWNPSFITNHGGTPGTARRRSRLRSRAARATSTSTRTIFPAAKSAASSRPSRRPRCWSGLASRCSRAGAARLRSKPAWGGGAVQGSPPAAAADPCRERFHRVEHCVFSALVRSAGGGRPALRVEHGAFVRTRL